jgi:predicted lipoprotein with Yx(FWY)xxD motif
LTKNGHKHHDRWPKISARKRKRGEGEYGFVKRKKKKGNERRVMRGSRFCKERKKLWFFFFFSFWIFVYECW